MYEGLEYDFVTEDDLEKYNEDFFTEEEKDKGDTDFARYPSSRVTIKSNKMYLYAKKHCRKLGNREVFNFGVYPQDSDNSFRFNNVNGIPTGKEFTEILGRSIFPEELIGTKKYIIVNRLNPINIPFREYIQIKPIEWLIDDKTQSLVSRYAIVGLPKDRTEGYRFLNEVFAHDIEPKGIRKFRHNIIENMAKKEMNPKEDLKVAKMVNDIHNDKIKELRAKANEQYLEYIKTVNQIYELSNDKEKKSLLHNCHVPIEDLLEKKDDHFVISSKYIKDLKFIDLTEISVLEKNIDFSGIDYTDTNLSINPQRVYNKDLHNCIFDENNTALDFSGVDIRGTDISKNRFVMGLDKAIMDENTKIHEELIEMKRH